MTSDLLQCVTLNPSKKATHTVIWLHGLGADGHDFEGIVPQLNLPESLAIKYLFPHAPVRSITINGGMAMRAWYDICDDSFSNRADIESIETSADQIKALIEKEIETGTPPEKILLAGFSQGGAITLHLGLRYEKKLAGLMALSTYIPTEKTLAAEKTEINANTPVLLTHGTYDPVIPIALGNQAHETLKSIGSPVTFHEYPMQHEVCMEEIRDIREWMIEVLVG